MTTRLLVTGGTGFVGSALLRRVAAEDGFEVTAAVRSAEASLPDLVRPCLVDHLGKDTDWSECLNDVDVVVHCAARAHIMSDGSRDPLAAFRVVNVDGTLNLALQAAAAGVRRFVFISSVKVNGESTDGRGPFCEDDVPAPEDPYGVSKQEAEAALRSVCRETGMELVVIRPPLVFGAGAKGNFRILMKLAKLPLPLPFGSVRNKRSLIYLENLVDFVVLAVKHPAAANETFLVSDGDDISTADLLKLLRRAHGLRPLLISVPERWIGWALLAAGKQSLKQRLMGNLQVDSGKARKLLGWTPPFSLEEGLIKSTKVNVGR